MYMQVHNTFLNIFLKPLLKSVENGMPLVKIIFSSNDSFWQFDGARKITSFSSAGISSHCTDIFFHQTLFRRAERFLANIHLLSNGISMGIFNMNLLFLYFCSHGTVEAPD